MKRLRSVVATALLMATLVTTPAGSRSAAVTEGCIPKEWGYRCLYGPIHVELDSEQDIRVIPAPPEAGYITSLYATLVKKNGHLVDHHAAHLHHIVFGNPNRDDLTCGSYPFNLLDRFFAVGKERSKLELPDGYGYFWDNQAPPGDYPVEDTSWAMIHHIHGMVEGYETDVFVRLDIGFVPSVEGTLTDVRPVWLDVRNCTDSTFDVTKNSGVDRIYREEWNYQMPIGGNFIALGGHLHDGGRKLRLDNSTMAQKLFVSRAGYSKTQRWDLETMSSYSGLPGRRVDAGDMLKLTAYYNDSKNWADVMGIMMAYLVPDPPAEP